MPFDIMYVGRKPTKWDNKNNLPNRIWRGLGQVITVPDLDASKLLEHSDIWRDVTKLDAKARSSAIAELQQQYTQERRKAREGQVLTLETATDEELEATLKQRRAQRGKAASNPVPSGLPTAQGAKGQKGSKFSERENDLGSTDRPANSDDLTADVFGVLATLDKDKDFDGQKKPYLERVNEKLGYQITQSELDTIYAAFKE